MKSDQAHEVSRVLFNLDAHRAISYFMMEQPNFIINMVIHLDMLVVNL